jgi:flavin reductase
VPGASGDDLRSLMRRFPAGVAVVGVDLEGERLALTIGTLIPLSLAPPLVGFAVRREAALHELLRRARRFGVSLLAAGQEDVAQHFARGVPPIALWNGIDVREDDPRLLAGAAAWLTARTVDHFRTGDHTFFVAELLTLEEGRAPTSLVYVHRGYHAL